MKGLSHLKNKQFTPLVMAMILASVTGNLFAKYFRWLVYLVTRYFGSFMAGRPHQYLRPPINLMGFL